MAQTTLKEIATILGISTSTVSKALKNYPDVSTKTKQKVMELAETLNYSPNAFAQSLRNKRSKIIGLIVPEINHDFFSKVIQGVVESAKKEEYLVIVLQSEESYESEINQIKLLLDKNVDGILISLSDKTVKYNHVQKVIDMGLPVVMFDKISKLINCPKVIINDTEAAEKATQYLIDTGCKTIAHIHGPLKPQTTIDRLKGYKKALANNHINYSKELVYTSDHLSEADGYHLAKTIVDNHSNIDAIFCFTDLVAIGVLKRLKNLNIAVPQKISVIGFSNWLLSEYTTPPLTTINQPATEMGTMAFSLLFKELNNDNKTEIIPKDIITLPTQLVLRNTTKNLKKL